MAKPRRFIALQEAKALNRRHEREHPNNLNNWTLIFAALAIAEAAALVIMARRYAAAKRSADELASDLQACNDHLEIFTPAISDELQAPLRELHRVGRQSLQVEEVDMRGLAREIADELAVRYPRSSVAIADLPPIRGDRLLLRRAFANLLDNALKFSAGSPAPRVEVGGRAHGRDIEYWVRDNGTGFDMAHRHRLFEVFQRLHTADEYAGTGTGLAMTRLIVARHGGSVRAQAKPGQGATFTVLLSNPAQ